MEQRQSRPTISTTLSQQSRSVEAATEGSSTHPGHRPRRNIVLCFDGTGNQYRGDGKETNILKIFRMLDKNSAEQDLYYQPGIGTYVVYDDLSHTDISLAKRIRAALDKTSDLAVGTSLGDHVIGGYKFLMRYHRPGDQIYIFGFSRGAYTARFLAEMLDDVGLLPEGNEEMVQFAWDTFARWQCRRGSERPTQRYRFWEFLRQRRDAELYGRAKEMWTAMAGFKHTFAREVEPIRFLGLFDTVNSVPQFEAPWLDRKKFPYSARSAAREIWHAVSIDERRVNFRPDLIYQSPEPRTATVRPKGSDEPRALTMSPTSPETLDQHNHENAEQQVHEVWFSGNHGDVGGGWGSTNGAMPHSHVPLVWMVRAASRAGLKFCPIKLKEMGITIPTTRTTHTRHDSAMSMTNFATDKDIADDTRVHDMLLRKVHDCLSPSPELSWHEVLRWNIAENIPFKRMDLQNGMWKAIRLPLPLGSTRDIPIEAKVHGSVIMRLQRNEQYCPQNLILGGGKELGFGKTEKFDLGKWEVVPETAHLDFFERLYVRKKETKTAQ